MPYITLTPAYGRDYKNKTEVLTDGQQEIDQTSVLADFQQQTNSTYNTALPCAVCGKETISEDELCNTCRHELAETSNQWSK